MLPLNRIEKHSEIHKPTAQSQPPTLSWPAAWPEPPLINVSCGILILKEQRKLFKVHVKGTSHWYIPRQEQIRRLQVCAQACAGLVFLCRSEAAQHEASAAPLRVQASYGLDWEQKVHVFKRRGPAHDGVLTLPSVPGGLADVLTPRLLRPSEWLRPVDRMAPAPASAPSPAAIPSVSRDNVHALGRVASLRPERRTAHH